MSQQTLHYAGGNMNKVRSMQKYLSLPIEHVHFETDEVQSLSVVEVAQKKVAVAFQTIQRPVFVEDFSAELDALKGLPGPLLKSFTERLNAFDICKLVSAGSSRAATMRLVLSLQWSTDTAVVTFVSSIKGWIVDEPRGNPQYVMQSIFQPYAYNATLSEMSETDLHDSSIRRAACEQLEAYVRKHYW